MLLTNVSAPTEGVHFVQPQVSAIVETDDLGQGVLTIAESSITWLKTGQDTQGFSLTYPSVCLHAISRDLSNFPQECLYLMVDVKQAAAKKVRRRPEIRFSDVTDDLAAVQLTAAKVEQPADVQLCADGGSEHNGGVETEEEPEVEDDDPGLVQIRFVPIDKSVLEQLFSAMSECQELNPDENDDFSDDEIGNMEENTGSELIMGAGDGLISGMGDGQWFTADSDDIELNEEGQANLQRILRNSAPAQDDTAANHEPSPEDAMDEN